MSDDLPAEFIDRLKQIIPSDRFSDVLASFRQPKHTAFRVNTLIADVDTTCRELSDAGIELSPISWCDYAFFVEQSSRELLVRSAAFNEGRIYVQNPSSLLPPILLAPQPGEVVLDLCAAPGGKTLHLAALMKNHGTLSAVEPIKKRFFKLQNNLKLAQASMVKTYLTDGRSVGAKTPDRFDRILIDAPCSSESRFRTADHSSWEFWSERKIREQSRKQMGLLKSAVRALKPGGTIVYCTCSFAPEENEAPLEKTIKRFGDSIEIQAIDIPLPNKQSGLAEWQGKKFNTQIRNAVRILPTSQMDGFFLCRLKKNA